MNVSNLCMDWPMLYTGNPYVIQPGNVFFMHMILMDSDNELAMNLGETYLVTENGNERIRAITYNNFACLFRKTRKLRNAL